MADFMAKRGGITSRLFAWVRRYDNRLLAANDRASFGCGPLDDFKPGFSASLLDIARQSYYGLSVTPEANRRLSAGDFS